MMSQEGVGDDTRFNLRYSLMEQRRKMMTATHTRAAVNEVAPACCDFSSFAAKCTRALNVGR